MSEAKAKAIRAAIKEFEAAVKAARSRYHEKISAIIKASDERKARAIKEHILSAKK